MSETRTFTINENITTANTTELTHDGEESCYFCKGKTVQSISINKKWLDLCEHCYQVVKGVCK